ncbi:winged helix-turn-helix domain-containing protein [Streptomyces sp. BV286]|uniref:AfsR/SARP family transcriptional regulator n=1 Tax=Streptomyces sp. BV286 TaxID=2849672 RepID=UPI001C2E5DE2|nr:BTAD domain-containing putative transcriptional regulator [Streptomyces sp. BV286]MBV1935717.1 winged helix-turn-helix domain-containing protein [Streptomyces sp. BV286]
MRVRRNGEDVTPSAPKLRQVLALLVLNANSLVSADQLCEELWEDHPPLSALTTLQTYIYQLRRKLLLATGQNGAHFGSRPPRGCPALLTRVGGYELRLDDKQSVDAYRFEQLTEQGMAQHRSGAEEEAARTLKEALSLWYGGALVDVTAGRRLSAWSTQLEERRKSVQEQRFSLELELGRHHAVLDELSEAFRTHPTHEAFAGQLMRAMHRCGRRPDALNTFRTLRSHLVEELGLEPSAQLQRLHQEVLADRGHLKGLPSVKTAPAGRRSGPGPAQLPAEVGDFIGRDRELSQLETFLGGDRASTGMRVVEVHGPPGVGKSAFAVRAAHRLRPCFPDGQLFIDLSAVGEGSQQLADVLSACLGACGIPREKQPTGLDELSRLFRTWTADRRVLVVVDDVLAASQLRAVLPGGSGCAVIATNRYRAHSLSTGRKVGLPALSAEESLQLYDRVAGERSRQQDPAAVQELMAMCEGLPLAVRAVAGRLTARPGWSAARLALRLRGNPRTLLELPAGTQSLMTTVAASHRHLPGPSQELLRLLLQRGRARWSLDEVTARMCPGTGDAETLLEYLVDVHLVEEHMAPGAEPLYSVPRLTRQALILLQRDVSAGDVPTGRTANVVSRGGASVTLMKAGGPR